MQGLNSCTVVHRRTNPFVKYGFAIVLVWNMLSMLGIFFLPNVKTPYYIISRYHTITSITSYAGAGGIVIFVFEMIFLAALLCMSVIAFIRFMSDEEYKLFPITSGITAVAWLNIYFYSLTFRDEYSLMFRDTTWTVLCIICLVISLGIGAAAAYIYYVIEPASRRRKRISII